MFCYNLILFHRQIAMIVGQIPCRHKFFDQRTAFLLVVHPGKYITASSAKAKIFLISLLSFKL